MEQKQVKLVGLRVLNNGIIQAAELTPDLLQKRLILVTGSIGNGKSTLLNAAKIATAGTDAIKKSDTLPAGFLAEALLVDGDTPIYIGVKTGTYSRGEKAGEKKLETYLYTKDANGKAVQPVIDGVAWTATQYWKALTTELTHSFNDLFSENQTVHRKLIEKLFKPELDSLKADEVMERIDAARKERDAARMLCQSSGAYMERFESEGYTEQMLESMKHIDINDLDRQITVAEIERDRIVNAPEAQYQLECNKIDQERMKRLQQIKDEGTELRNKLNAEQAAVDAEYDVACAKYELVEKRIAATKEEYRELRKRIAEFIGYNDTGEKRNEQGEVFHYDQNGEVLQMMDAIAKQKIAGMSTMQKPVKGEVSAALKEQLASKLAEYKALQDTPVKYPERQNPDTSEVNRKIEELKRKKESAVHTNKLCERYRLWRNWIEAKGIYEKEIDTLRKIYAQVDTGVPGMKIVPRDTESGRVEVWVMYNAEYDPAYFGNPGCEQRFLFDYSSFQRTLIGLMLQAARLNLKPRALRLAFVDDVAFTARDVSVLHDIAEKLDVKLITAWTHEVDRDSLIEGQVMVDGGEVFFND